MQGFKRILAPIERRIMLLIGRAVLVAVNNSESTQKMQLNALKDEVITDCERVQPYGLDTYPLAGAEVIAAFINGNRDHGLILQVGDRRYRLTDLSAGEVALYTDEDKSAGGHRIHLKRGQIIHMLGKILTGIFTSSVTFTVPTFTVNGNITATGDVSDSSGTAQTMAAMRAAYNPHTHPGGAGFPPNPLM